MPRPKKIAGADYSAPKVVWGAKVKAAYKALLKSMSSEAKVAIAPYAKLILARVQEKIRHDKSFDPWEYRELPGLEMQEENVIICCPH